MDKARIETLLSDALASEVGLLVATNNYSAARLLRRRLYTFRDRQKRNGRHEYDGLSFVAKPSGELLIIKQEAVRPVDEIPAYPTRELSTQELPRKLIVRGKHRMGVINMLALELMSDLQV